MIRARTSTSIVSGTVIPVLAAFLLLTTAEVSLRVAQFYPCSAAGGLPLEVIARWSATASSVLAVVTSVAAFVPMIQGMLSQDRRRFLSGMFVLAASVGVAVIVLPILGRGDPGIALRVRADGCAVQMK